MPGLIFIFIGFTVKMETKPKRRNPKRRQEMVGLCEAFKHLFRAYTIIAVQSNIKHILKVTSQQLITK